MVKGRKNNRRKGGSKVSRRSKRRDLVKITDTSCGDEWKRGTTLAGNYGKMGLTLDVNDLSNASEAKNAVNGDDNENNLGEKWIKQRDAGELDEAPRRKPFWMSDEEILYLKPLLEKYSDDYAKMSRDIKRNSMQHTASWLKRKCVRYAKFLATKDEDGSKE